ncbi:MAG: RidA family protein [Proteobacteria bacterium]|nr:RidA family protein [Pseudomonadota bacterium]
MKTVQAVALGLAFCAGLSLLAEAATEGGFKKEYFNYSEWAKGRFSEVVSVTNPQRFIYLAGVGAEDETATVGGKIRHTDDVYAQCKYAWDKVKRSLEKQNASLADIVKVTTYVTDMRSQPDVGKCRAEVLAGLPLPAHTLVGVSALAWPGMMFEVDVTAVKANDRAAK